MYGLVFASSCFLFYILQRWFRNVKAFGEKTIEFFHSCKPPTPKRTYDASSGKNRYQEASLTNEDAAKFFLVGILKDFFDFTFLFVGRWSKRILSCWFSIPRLWHSISPRRHTIPPFQARSVTGPASNIKGKNHHHWEQ